MAGRRGAHEERLTDAEWVARALLEDRRRAYANGDVREVEIELGRLSSSRSLPLVQDIVADAIVTLPSRAAMLATALPSLGRDATAAVVERVAQHVASPPTATFVQTAAFGVASLARVGIIAPQSFFAFMRALLDGIQPEAPEAARLIFSSVCAAVVVAGEALNVAAAGALGDLVGAIALVARDRADLLSVPSAYMRLVGGPAGMLDERAFALEAAAAVQSAAQNGWRLVLAAPRRSERPLAFEPIPFAAAVTLSPEVHAYRRTYYSATFLCYHAESARALPRYEQWLLADIARAMRAAPLTKMQLVGNGLLLLAPVTVEDFFSLASAPDVGAQGHPLLSAIGQVVDLVAIDRDVPNEVGRVMMDVFEAARAVDHMALWRLARIFAVLLASIEYPVPRELDVPVATERQQFFLHTFLAEIASLRISPQLLPRALSGQVVPVGQVVFPRASPAALEITAKLEAHLAAKADEAAFSADLAAARDILSASSVAPVFYVALVRAGQASPTHVTDLLHHYLPYLQTMKATVGDSPDVHMAFVSAVVAACETNAVLAEIVLQRLVELKLAAAKPAAEAVLNVVDGKTCWRAAQFLEAIVAPVLRRLEIKNDERARTDYAATISAIVMKSIDLATARNTPFYASLARHYALIMAPRAPEAADAVAKTLEASGHIDLLNALRDVRR